MTASQQGRSCLMPLLLIAALLGGTVGSVPSAAAAPVVYFVPQTGHTIELGFAQYVATHGGVEVTGYPLTEEIDEHGRVVQYFQHLRLEWHPEYPAAQQVYAGQLGLELHKAQPP